MPPSRPAYAGAIEPYARPHVGRALLDLATSIVPVVLLGALSLSLPDALWWVALLLGLPLAGFLLRTFIVFHDCAHGSFLPGFRTNRWLGRALGVVVFQAYDHWAHDHRVHHNTAGDLDRRGTGDVPTLTVAEYRARSPRARLAYRLFRHPAVMFTIGPLYAMVINPRIVPKGARARARRSILLTDVAVLAMVGAIVAFHGPVGFLLAFGPAILLAGTAGVWLFYVQHQFEDAYWEGSESWSYADAALRGSSYLRLPKVLQFFTGNIGLHHVHHLSAKVPNYRLQAAHDDLDVFRDVPVLTLRDGLRAHRLKLWDEESRRLVGFAAARSDAAPTGTLAA